VAWATIFYTKGSLLHFTVDKVKSKRIDLKKCKGTNGPHIPNRARFGYLKIRIIGSKMNRNEPAQNWVLLQG
jgi:hypothetical protein